ncbi:hypothetical protein GCM10011352_39190 [Marinobacterium zhoushanense]|uniref:Uncharacterized protein n=1 Tax=Marinobacterium zhoushanense TaxID=1679163 RepID=A0ABQ1KSV9_9GAMM|nr:replication initiation protein [Marinobacterium zhoushanense]GGC08978.1 hypothetical protein GCM10011352_39190 [Marinobacterium zhoushanense]
MIYKKYLPKNVVPLPVDMLDFAYESLEVTYEVPLFFYLLNAVSNQSITKENFVYDPDHFYRVVRKVAHIKKEESFDIINNFIKKIESSDFFYVARINGEVSYINLKSDDFYFRTIKLVDIDAYLGMRSKYAKRIFLHLVRFTNEREGYIYFYDLMKRLDLKDKDRPNQTRIARNIFKSLMSNGLISEYSYSRSNYKYVYKLNGYEQQKDFQKLTKDQIKALGEFY